MTLWRMYYLAESVAEAVRLLNELPGTGRIIAGGTDLLLDLRQGRHPPLDWLVDVTAIPELNRLEKQEEGLFVGAAVPLHKIVDSPLVRRHAYAVYEAASLIGGPQVRNVATLGGNVIHALPAGDGSIALLALGANAEVADSAGRRMVPIEKLFLGVGQSALQAGQLLVGFHLPLCSLGEGSAFKRVMRPQGVAIAILNMAIWVHVDGAIIRNLRIAMGPAGTVPYRARELEKYLSGKPFNPDTFEQAKEKLLIEAHFRTSPHRASASYRRRLAGVLFAQTLQEAISRAGYVILE